MKKLLMLLVMALLFVPGVIFAQKDDTITLVEESGNDSVKIITTTVIEKEYVFTNGFWHNWEMLIAIGPHAYIGENDKKFKSYLELITFPAIDFMLTKWASPSIGISGGFTYGRFKGLYQSCHHDFWYGANYQTDEYYYDADPKWDYMKLARQSSFFVELIALAHFDLLNVINGYNPQRRFAMDCYAGGGVMLGDDKTGVIRSGAFNLGIINKFRINDYMRLVLAVRGAFVADDFDGELYVDEPSMDHRMLNINMDGNIGITAGLTVFLGKQHSKWRPASRVTELVQSEKVKEVYVGEAESDMAMNVQSHMQIPKFWFHINFEIDRWELSTKEMVNLRAIADAIESTPGVRYLICGYADMQTASSAHNVMLSRNRANTVFNFLTLECGVDPNSLIIDYKGGVDYMFYDEEQLSRCVMITTIQE